MRIILDTDNEQNFVDLWNPEKNNWERYIKCDEKENEETKPLEDKKIEKLEYIENGEFIEMPSHQEFMSKINEIIDKINGG